MTAAVREHVASPKPPSRFGEVRYVAAIALLLLLAVSGLFLVSRNKASSTSSSPAVLLTPIITADAGCQNFATYWMTQSGLDVDASVIEGLSDCWQAANGSWIVPTGPTDSRLPANFALTDTERTATNALRQRLVAQVTELSGSLSFSVQRDLDGIYDPRVRPVSGHIKDGASISRARDRYTRVVQAYLMSPQHEDLAAYVGWLMERKIDAYNQLNNACQSNPDTAYLKTVCVGLQDSLNIRFPPFLWDLRSTTSMEAYLAYAVRNGQVPPASSARSQVPESSARDYPYSA